MKAKHYVSCYDIDDHADCCSACHYDEDEGYGSLLDQESRTNFSFCCARSPTATKSDKSPKNWQRLLIAKALRNQRNEERKAAA